MKRCLKLAVVALLLSQSGCMIGTISRWDTDEFPYATQGEDPPAGRVAAMFGLNGLIAIGEIALAIPINTVVSVAYVPTAMVLTFTDPDPMHLPGWVAPAWYPIAQTIGVLPRQYDYRGRFGPSWLGRPRLGPNR